MTQKEMLSACTLCPRECGVNRYESTGFCGEGANVRIARAALHMWEEPCISGKSGSGAVFFSGCSLKCVFCQNHEISAQGKGFEVSEGRLCDIFLSLQRQGAQNINLVSPTHFALQIANALDMAGDRLHIPVVYNCGGYEKSETLEMLRGKIDIFLPDLKYFDSEISAKFSSAADYFPKALNAIRKMVDIVGKPLIDENNVMQKGVIVRHLVLPNCRHDSQRIITALCESFDRDEIMVSLMSQFTPVYKAFDYKELSRKASTFEYSFVCRLLEESGFEGFKQQRSSADSGFIPKFYDYDYI